MLTQEEKTNCLLTKSGEKRDSKEISTEYTLPDYLPDITKLLRVTARTEAPGKYISSDTVEYDGTICYNIVYATSDGEIKNAEIKDDYEGSVSLPGAADASIIDMETYTENINCRLSSPRKLTVKAKLLTFLTAFSENCTEPAVGGKISADTAKELQYRKEKVQFAGEINAEEKNIPVSEDIEIDPGMPQIADIVSVFLDPTVNDIKYADGKINYVGTVNANILYEAVQDGNENEKKKYVSFTREIPISGSVDTENDLDFISALCDTDIKNISYRPQTNDLGDAKTVEVDFDYSVLFKIYFRNECDITTDMYSLDFENSTDSETLSYRTLEGSKTFNFSFNESAPFEDKEFPNILSSSAISDISSAEKNGNKIVLSGNVILSVILGNGDGAYIGKNYTIPYKAETDIAKCPEDFEYSARSFANSLETRITDDKIYAGAEITVNIVIFGKNTANIIKSCTVYTDRPISIASHSNVVLYYPSRGDKLWNIAKKYNTTVEKIASANGLSGEITDNGVIIIPTEKPKSKFIRIK